MEITKVFVIIVTYNGKRWYDRCFGSLRASDMPVQTVVIDNGSADDTVSYIRTNFPEVYLIESDKNLGFGQGNNKGIRYALDQGADYVFLLNQDAWIEPDALSELTRIHQLHPEYGILSPLHLNADKTAFESGFSNYIADLKITDVALLKDALLGHVSDVYDTRYVNAAAWFLPRKTLEIVGGFDPVFFHYGEDDNYIHRVKYHGMKIGICPGVKVVHDTEVRVPVSDELITMFQSRWQIILLELTDITRDFRIYTEIRFYIMKTIKCLLKLQFKKMADFIYHLNLIISQRQKIKASRIQNKKSTTSWL